MVGSFPCSYVTANMVLRSFWFWLHSALHFYDSSYSLCRSHTMNSHWNFSASCCHCILCFARKVFENTMPTAVTVSQVLCVIPLLSQELHWCLVISCSRLVACLNCAHEQSWFVDRGVVAAFRPTLLLVSVSFSTSYFWRQRSFIRCKRKRNSSDRG